MLSLLRGAIHYTKHVTMPHWTEIETFSAPNPKNGVSPLRLTLSAELVRIQSSVNKASVIYQAWCHLGGKLPPVNNIAVLSNSKPSVTISTLHDSVACFCGLRRPHDDERNGDSVLIYVLNPKISLEYSPSMVCLVRPVTIPSNTVLTVQVRPNFPLQQGNNGIDGTVTRIEFVFNDEKDARLPRDFETRYDRKMWDRKK